MTLDTRGQVVCTLTIADGQTTSGSVLDALPSGGNGLLTKTITKLCFVEAPGQNISIDYQVPGDTTNWFRLNDEFGNEHIITSPGALDAPSNLHHYLAGISNLRLVAASAVSGAKTVKVVARDF